MTAATAEKVTGIWKEVLKRETIDQSESFFDMNGNSLQAVIMMEMIKQELNVDLSIQDIYAHETLEAFLHLIEEQTAPKTISVTGKVDTEIVDAGRRLTSAVIRDSFEAYNGNALHAVSKTYRMFRFQRYLLEMSKKNYLGILSTRVHVRGATTEQVKAAVYRFIAEQEALRTGAAPGHHMHVYDSADWQIPVIDMAQCPETRETICEGLADARNAMNLFGEGQLLAKVLIIVLSGDEHLVRVYAHHSIWDRMSHLVVADRLEAILKGEAQSGDGILDYSEYVRTRRPTLGERARVLGMIAVRLTGALLRYMRSIRGKRFYSMTICKTMSDSMRKGFQQDALQTTARLYVQCHAFTTGYAGRLPIAVLTNGRNRRNANTLGLWLNTIVAIYNPRFQIMKTTHNLADFSSEANPELIYEIMPRWSFRFLAHHLPILNYVGLFPEYQGTNEDLLQVVPITDSSTAAARLTKLGENIEENRLTIFTSGDKMHCTMKVYADSEEEVRRMAAAVFGWEEA